MITRQQLEIINRRFLKYPLQIAEKDYFLAIVLQLIAESSLGGNLVFKGGTAIHHCYLDQYRFSEDLDFSSNQKPLKLTEVKNIFEGADYLSIKKEYLSGDTVKIEGLQYTGPLIHPNSLKVEIDFLQNVLLPPQIMPYKNVWGIDCKVQVMDIKEIAAEKIRAMSDRARYRDFYDLYLILEKYKLNLIEIIGYIKLKEIRKPITKTNINNNLMVIGTQKEAEMTQVYYSRTVDDERIKAMIESLPFTEIPPAATSHKQQKGFITLISVLVVGAVGIAIALSLLLLGVGNSRTSFAVEQSNQAKALANACAEEALQQIRDSTSFTGTASLTLGQGTCTYTVTSQGGSNRTITASGTVGTIIRKVKIIISGINPQITVTSWQEVADL